MLKLGIVSSFHPHSMCERVERVTKKSGYTSCTNWINSFGVSGSRTRTHLSHGPYKDNMFPQLLGSQNDMATGKLMTGLWLLHTGDKRGGGFKEV